MRRLTFAFLLLGSPAFAAGPEPLMPSDFKTFEEFLLVQSFDCSNKTCGQMASCEEACHKLLVCGHGKRDGDGDGIPCESLCSRPCR